MPLYSNSLDNNKIKIYNKNFSFNFSKSSFSNKNESKINLFSINSADLTKKEKGFRGLGIAGIILTTVGLCLGVPDVVLFIYLKQYIDSPVSSSNVVGAIVDGIILKPLAVILFAFVGIFMVVTSIITVTGIIFIAAGFGNFTKLRKERKTSFFIDSKNNDLRAGLSFRL